MSAHLLSPRYHNLTAPQDMLVAVIAEDLQPPYDEGAKKAAFHLVSSLRELGIRVSLFTRRAAPASDDAFTLPTNKLLLGKHFAQVLCAQAPDVLLYIPSSSGTLGAFARAASLKMQSAGKPLAMFNMQYRKLPAAARWLGLRRFVDVVFTQSEASAAAVRLTGCPTVLIPGSVDRSVFRPVSRAEKSRLRSIYGFTDEERIILHVGHVNRKRSVTILEHLVQPGYRVVLVASTSTTADEQLLSELRQVGITVVTGFIEHIQHYYQLADCYVFPVVNVTSAVDAPLSVLEAMACNLPVVSTPFGALVSMFSPANGLYFTSSPGDALLLVRRALEDPHCRTSEMVSAYTWENAALKMIETFQRIGPR